MYDLKMSNKPGPKTELGPQVRTKNCSFTLDARTMELLAVIGENNLSRGVRRSAEIAYDEYQRQGKIPLHR